jgi:signal transduction histidine kinase
LQRALEIYSRFDLKRYVANTHRRLASVLRGMRRTDEALAQLAMARDIAEPLGSPEVLSAIYRGFALTHEARGEWRQALEFERRVAAANEAGRQDRDRQRIAELQTRYDLERREHEIVMLRTDQELKVAEIRRRRLFSLALAGCFGVGLVTLGAIIAVQRIRLHSERRLREANERARKQAESADHLKSRLLQMASHDLKAPLSSLKASADRIARSAHDGELVTRLAEGIRIDTARMGKLVRDFLDHAAIEAGRLKLHREQVDLAEIGRAAVQGLAPVASAKGQELTVLPPTDPWPLVEADTDRLRQVFDNLLSNALKFTPAGGQVELSFGTSADRVYAEVRDTGPGLSPQDFAKLFAPQGGEGSGFGGTSGLGLFITRELLALHGGHLEIESQPGSGALFRVVLPLAGVVSPAHFSSSSVPV